jgi:hypothetical protein
MRGGARNPKASWPKGGGRAGRRLRWAGTGWGRSEAASEVLLVALPPLPPLLCLRGEFRVDVLLLRAGLVMLGSCDDETAETSEGRPVDGAETSCGGDGEGRKT